MYLCTVCGLMKSELGSNPEFEFRRRRHPDEEPHVEGTSDWCSHCETLRFFFKYGNEKKLRKLYKQQLMENAQKKSRNQGPEACRKSRPPKSKGYRDTKAQEKKTRQEAQELLMMITAGSIKSLKSWNPKLRSLSEDQSRKNPKIERRSKSVVNESPEAILSKRQSKQLKDLYMPEATKFNKYASSSFLSHNNACNLEDKVADDDSRSSSPGLMLKLPFDQKVLEKLVKPWEKDIKQRQLDVLNERVKNTKNKKDIKDIKPKNASKSHTPGDLMLMKVQEMQERKSLRYLNTEIKEKKHQMMEWKRIRRHVDNEYERVKNELNELKCQNDIGKEHERIQGGALISAIKSYVAIDDNETLTEKTIGDALDEKMEHMLELLQEANATPVINEEQQINVDEESDKSCDKAIGKFDEISTNSSIHTTRELSKLNILVSTVQRARFRGFAEDPKTIFKRFDQTQLSYNRDPPLPQFQTMPCARKDLVNLLHIKRDALQPQHVRPLKVCHTPIYCPDCDCRRMFFISDFNEHLTHEHPSLPMERISPNQAKTFFLDTHATQLNKAKCNMVYFVKNKFFDDNSTGDHPDLLPVLVMSSRLRLTELFTPTYDQTGQLRPLNYHGVDNEIFLIWLTSVSPDDAKIIGTISIWPTSSNPFIEYLLVHTNEIYNIRSSQKLRNIFISNRIVVLSGNFVSRLTDNGKNLMAVQVQIH